MSRLAPPAQMRASLLRWTLFVVPAVMLLGFLSGYLAGSSAENAWFAMLRKPSVYPPPILFPIVWTVLYAAMGFAAALVGAARNTRLRGPALLAFVVQLAINLAWSPMFFAAHRIDAALAVILALDIVVIITLILFWKVRKLAGLLLLPYLVWILFATWLTWDIWRLNPNANGAVVTNAVQRIEI